MIDYRSKKFSIGDASSRTGATVKQIRNWEEQGYITKATRIICGERSYRSYSEKDLEAIKRIKSYLDEGFRLPVSVEKAGKELSGKEGGK